MRDRVRSGKTVWARRAAARSEARALKTSEIEETLNRINELSRTARTLWFVLLGYFTFIGVTLLGVTDADFFLTERQTQLPLLGVSIPTNLFFSFAPVLGAAVYIYLHHHLMKLWQALGDAPETVRGLHLSDHLVPWIITDVALDLRPNRALRPQPFPWLTNSVTVIVVFLAAPAVLAVFWWRSMPAHSWGMTLASCGVSLLFALFVMVESGKAFWHLRRAEKARDAVGTPDVAARSPWAKALPWGFFAVALTSFGFVQTVEPAKGIHRAYLEWRDAGQITEATVKRDEAEKRGDKDAARKAKADLKEIKDRHRAAIDAARWDRFPFDLTPAQLSGVVFVEKPDDWRDFDTARAAFRVSWCKNEGLPPASLSSADRDKHSFSLRWEKHRFP